MKKDYKFKFLRISPNCLFMLIVIVFIQGCATFTPIPEGYTGPLSTIEDTSEYVSSTKVYFFQLTEINGRSVKSSSIETRAFNYGRGISMTPMTARRSVPAEKSILRIEGMTHVAAPILALGGKMYSVKGEVEIDLKPNSIYRIKGELSKDYSAVWVENIAGKIVSKKIIKGTSKK